MTYRYGRTSPGPTWVRCQRVDAGIRCHYPVVVSYIWRRSPLRMVLAWAAIIVIFVFLAYGLCQ